MSMTIFANEVVIYDLLADRHEADQTQDDPAMRRAPADESGPRSVLESRDVSSCCTSSRPRES
jgi:hypothetical protein